MPVPPKIPGKEVAKRLRAQIAKGSRSPFQNVLADALSVAPSPTAWRHLARKSPDRYVAAVTSLAKTAGYADRSESVSMSVNINQLAEQLVTRYGPERARQMLELHGLPASTLIPDQTAQIRAEQPEIPADTLPADPAETA